MDTHRLKYFLRIADEGSITRAARLLGIAQPALSRQLQLLEEDLGVTLFARTRRGVELTDAGARLRASTAAPLASTRLGRAIRQLASCATRTHRTSGLLRNNDSHFGRTGDPQSHNSFPRRRVLRTAGSTDDLVEALLKGSVDVAMVNPVPDERVFYREILQEDLVLVGSRESGLEPTQPVAFTDLVQLPLIIPRSPSGTATLLRNAALRTKVSIDYQITTDSLQVTKTLLTAGLGYSTLPLSACRHEIDEGLLRYAPITDPVLTHQLGLAATAQLDLPREFVAKAGNTIREEIAALINTGRWQAQLLSPMPWNPSHG